MGDGHFDVLAAQVYDGVERVFGEVGFQQVEQSVAAVMTLAVEIDFQTGVEVGVVLHHRQYEVEVEAVTLEQLCVGCELDEGAVGLLGGEIRGLVEQFGATELSPTGHPVAVGLDDK